METPQKLIANLKKNNLSLAVAESASGGYASFLLTKTPGSSQVFKGGLIVYSLETKHKFFRIAPKLLEKTQGVSQAIAIDLAKKVSKLFSSDIGASIVGFAGPDVKKGAKVGTIFMAVAYKGRVTSNKIIIKGSRNAVQKKASQLLINLIYKQIISD